MGRRSRRHRGCGSRPPRRAEEAGLRCNGAASLRATLPFPPSRPPKRPHGAERRRVLLTKRASWPTTRTRRWMPIPPRQVPGRPVVDQLVALDHQRVLRFEALDRQVAGVGDVDLDAVEAVLGRAGPEAAADRLQVHVVLPRPGSTPLSRDNIRPVAGAMIRRESPARARRGSGQRRAGRSRCGC